jgi:hypothetical protein
LEGEAKKPVGKTLLFYLDIITKILDVKLSLTETDAVDAEHSGWSHTASNYGDKEAYWETFLLYKHSFYFNPNRMIRFKFDENNRYDNGNYIIHNDLKQY